MKPVPLMVFITFAVSLSVAGCARDRIVIDKKNVDMSAYDHDLAECRTYAEETDSVGAEAAKGAVGGAIVGGVIGAVLGTERTAEKLGGVGAVTGAVQGASKGKEEKSQIVKNCLSGRGYKVLN